MKFSLYDAASGGNRLYTSSGTTSTPAAISVTVTSGLFSVLIGDTGQNALDINWNQNNIYLGVTIGADAEMTPRKRLSAVPYAFNAETLQGNYASSSVTSTGGALMALNQVATDAASAPRTALFVQTNGTSNSNDFLIKGNNGTSDVFTVNRQGNVTSTDLSAQTLNAGQATATTMAWTNASGTSLTLSGKAVCLADGTNCLPSSSSGTSTFPFQDGSTANTVYLTTSTRSVLLGGNTTSTSGFVFTPSPTSGTSSLFIGGTTNTNMYVGTSTYGGGLPAGFFLNGNDLLVQGGVGSVEGLFSGGNLAVNGSTTLGDNATSDLLAVNARLTTSLTPSLDLSVSLGTAGLRWLSLEAGSVTSTNLYASSVGLLSASSTYLFATQATATTMAWTNASGTSLTVSGQSVCLADGTNCPVVPSLWTENALNNILYPTTLARSVMLGGNTTNTSGFVFTPSPTSGTSSLFIGGTTNTNMYVGTSTYGGGLTSNFVMNGNDALFQGQIGSIEGMFSATGVQVGTGTTVYGDGNLYKTNAGDFTMALNDLASNWRMYTSGAERFTVASSGNIGIGRTTPLDALDVNGNVRNLLSAGQVFTTIASTTGKTIPDITSQGNYVYYISTFPTSKFTVMDMTDPMYPKEAGSVSYGATSLSSVFVSGRYAYVTAGGDSSLKIIDISNPTTPVETMSVAVGGTPTSVYVSGKYAYVTDGSTSLNIIDVSNPFSPTTITSFSLGFGSAPSFVSVQGRYAYVFSRLQNRMYVVDVNDPSAPSVVGTWMAGSFKFLERGAVKGRYVYITDSSADGSLYTVDVSDPTFPYTVATTTPMTGTKNVLVSGRYAYVMRTGASNVAILDVASSTAPVQITSTAVSISSPQSSTLVGRYLVVASGNKNGLAIIDTKGIETNGLSAASADIGSLKVQSDAIIGNQLVVGSSLNVGAGGIFSHGPIAAYGALSVNAQTTSTFTGGVSITGGLTVPGYQTITGVLSARNIDQTVPSTGGFGAFSYKAFLSVPNVNETVVQGRYAYAATSTGINVIDVSDATVPKIVGAASGPGVSGPSNIAAAGRYAYTANRGSGNMSIYDISNPALPQVKSTTFIDASAQPNDIAVSGRYAYVLSTGRSSFQIFDITDPAAPISMSSTTTPVSDPESVYIQGQYAYITTRVTDRLFVYDISQPSSPTLVGTKTYTAGNNPGQVVVSGRYAYIPIQVLGSAAISVVDVSNPSSPVGVGTSTAIGASGTSLAMSGRYLYFGDYGVGQIAVIDVASSTNPVGLAYPFVPSGSVASVIVSGRDLYISDITNSMLSILDITGSEMNGLRAHSAELGSLQVMSNATVANDFTVGGGLNVGPGGIYAQGELSVYASTTAAYAASIVNGANGASSTLYVQSGCGDLDVTRDLILAGNSTDNRKFSVRCNGQVYADGAYAGTGADFAEYFASAGSAPDSGDVVTLDASGKVVFGTAGTRDAVIGVVSAKPGFVGNTNDVTATSSVIVGLLGQIPTHASAVSSPIFAGDFLMAGDGGTAVKANGPGMVIGRALDPLASGTSTILVYVSPQWWAGDLFGISGASDLAMHDLTMASTTVASVSAPTVNSPAFAFRGSAWDAVALAPTFSSFSLFNNVMSPTTSLFTIANASGTSLLTVSDLGNASITGDLVVNKRLFLGSKSTGLNSDVYLFADDTVPGSRFVSTNADGFQTSSTYDYAERYSSTDDLVPGDLVTADASGVNKVRRAASAADAILGIVSTRPGFVTGAYSTGTYPIALAGRVPTRISTRNGAIRIGDHLMASDIPGVAVKAVDAGNTVGIALESYDRPEDGLISVFVKTGWQGGAISSSGTLAAGASASGTTSSVGSHRSGLAKVYAGSTDVKVTFPTIMAFPIIQATPYGQAKGGYWFTNISDTGFTIVLGEAPTFDLLFAWTVDPSASGGTMYFSDNTSAPYDALTGSPVLTTTSASTSAVAEPPSTTTSTIPPAGTTSSTSSTTP